MRWHLRFFLLFAVVAQLVFAQPKLAPQDYWAETKLSLKLVRKILNDKDCKKHFNSFLACLSAVNNLYAKGNPPHILLPGNAKKSLRAGVVYKVDDDTLIANRIEIDPKKFKTRSDLRKAVFEDRKLIEEGWRKIYERKKGMVFDWGAIVDDLLKFYQDPQKAKGEAEAVSLLFNGYYAVADGPHSRIETSKQNEELDENGIKENVEVYTQKDGVLLIRLSSFFNPKAYSDIEIALNRPEKTRAKKVVLDLRNNRGGHLYIGMQIASLFLPSGSEVIRTRRVRRINDPDFWIGLADIPEYRLPFTAIAQLSLDLRSEEDKFTKTTQRSPIFEGPMAVLVNEKSSSGSEVLAGAFRAIQINKKPRAILVGTRTFGKGTVVSVDPWEHDKNIKLRKTTSVFYSADGQTPHIRGIPPDVFAGPHPNDTEENMLVMRAEELYDHNIEWNLPEEIKPSPYIKEINDCVARHGNAKRYFLDEEKAKKVSPGDYPLGVAIDALKCPVTPELAPMPREVKTPMVENK